MSLGSQIYATAQANAPLVVLIGTKIYPVVAPQSAIMPYVVWQKVASDPANTHGEQSSEADSLNQVQFTVLAATHDSLEAVCAALIAAFEGVKVLTNHAANLEGEQDLSSEVPNAFLRGIDFTF